MRYAEGFIDRAASVAKSYFNVSGAASKQSALFKRENTKLRERESKLNSDNAELMWPLDEQEERVNVANLRKA